MPPGNRPSRPRIRGAFTPLALVLVLPLWLAVLAPPSAQAQDATARIQQQVQAIVAGGDIEGRREAIVARLSALSLDPERMPFEPPAGGADRAGVNVLATVSGPADRPLLLLGAHYDEIGGGGGAIDNAAGVTAVLELAQAFLREPLQNHRVAVALWDLEEDGLLGSRALVADSARRPLPAVYVNFDIFGYGDAFYVGVAEQGTALPRAVQGAAEVAGLGAAVELDYPPSDHLSFRGTSASSYAVSLLDRAEIAQVLTMIRPGAGPGTPLPRVLQIIHTPGDTLGEVDAAAMARGVAAMERALRTWDAQSGPRPNP